MAPAQDNASGLDHALARALAEAAGRLLLQLRQQAGFSPEQLREQGDRRAHESIVDALAKHRPQDCVLSEEGKDDPARLSAERVWIVDPLDGTREYGENGRHDWAVHVALWERGSLAAAAVALPGLDEVLGTDHPPRIPTESGVSERPLRIAVSRTRPPALLQELARVIDVELVPLGSAGFKTVAVVRGEVDAYVHSGGQYEWDSAAPVAVAIAAGAVATRIDGSPLVYNRPDPLLPDLAVVRPSRAAALRGALDRVLDKGVA